VTAHPGLSQDERLALQQFLRKHHQREGAGTPEFLLGHHSFFYGAPNALARVLLPLFKRVEDFITNEGSTLVGLPARSSNTTSRIHTPFRILADHSGGLQALTVLRVVGHRPQHRDPSPRAASIQRPQSSLLVPGLLLSFRIHGNLRHPRSRMHQTPNQRCRPMVPAQLAGASRQLQDLEQPRPHLSQMLRLQWSGGFDPMKSGNTLSEGATKPVIIEMPAKAGIKGAYSLQRRRRRQPTGWSREIIDALNITR